MVPLLQSQLFAARARIRAGRESRCDRFDRPFYDKAFTDYLTVPRFQLMGKRENAAV